MKYLPCLFFIFVIAFPSCESLKTSTKREPLPQKFSVDFNSTQIQIGTAETQVDLLFPRSGLAKKNIEILYFPSEDAVCLKYKPNIFTYHLFFDFEARELFRKSLQQYMTEYENREIINNANMTKSIYGITEGYLFWQEFNITRRFNAHNDIDFGYIFKKRAPYFSITQKRTFFRDRAIDDPEKRDTYSQEIVMHFTRAQAQELAELFNEEQLKTHSLPRAIRRGGTADVDSW